MYLPCVHKTVFMLDMNCFCAFWEISMGIFYNSLFSHPRKTNKSKINYSTKYCLCSQSLIYCSLFLATGLHCFPKKQLQHISEPHCCFKWHVPLSPWHIPCNLFLVNPTLQHPAAVNSHWTTKSQSALSLWMYLMKYWRQGANCSGCIDLLAWQKHFL